MEQIHVCFSAVRGLRDGYVFGTLSETEIHVPFKS